MMTMPSMRLDLPPNLPPNLERASLASHLVASRASHDWSSSTGGWFIRLLVSYRQGARARGVSACVCGRRARSFLVSFVSSRTARGNRAMALLPATTARCPLLVVCSSFTASVLCPRRPTPPPRLQKKTWELVRNDLIRECNMSFSSKEARRTGVRRSLAHSRLAPLTSHGD